MFKDDYNNDMDRIVPDPSVKNHIRYKLRNAARVEECNKEKPKKIERLKLLRSSLALAACMALMVSAFFVHNAKGNFTVTTKKTTGDLSVVGSYTEIYKQIKKLSGQNGWNWFGLKKYSNSVVEYAVDAEAGATAATGSSTAVADTGKDIAAPTENTSDANNINSATEDDYSKTTTQVDGVDEADIVKTDGKFIYSLFDGCIKVASAKNGNLALIQTIQLPDSSRGSYREMYLTDNRLTVIFCGYDETYTDVFTKAYIYDVSKPAKAESVGSCRQSGDYQSSRMIGKTLYLISNYSVRTDKIKEDQPATYIPSVECKGSETILEPSSIRMYNDTTLSPIYLTACAYNVADATLSSTQSVLGSAETVYCSTGNIITAAPRYDNSDTGTNYSVVTRFAIKDGKIEYKANGRINGSLINQFAIDEFDGYFRFVTTVNSYKTQVSSGSANSGVASVSLDNSAALYVLNPEMISVGKIENLAPGERVYSVRFMGKTAYFVTFRQTDPLFSADLSDPKNPKIIGQLKIPGFSNYLFPYGEGKLLGIGMDANEVTGRTNGMKLSMFDISDPANVTESDKTLLQDAQYSEALYNHKACLINYDKNLIGFPVYTGRSVEYRVFSHGEGFKQLATLSLDDLNYNVQGFEIRRGLYIGNTFYLVSDRFIRSYDLTTFTQIGTLML